MAHSQKARLEKSLAECAALRGSWSSITSVFQEPSRNRRTAYMPTALDVCMREHVSSGREGEVAETVWGLEDGISKRRQMRSCLVATTASADINQQSPTAPCSRSAARNP